MTLSVTHAFVSAIPDDPTPTLVRPQSNWNAAHTLTGQADVTQGGTGLASGTSGGIPYFNSTTSMLSSALLAANLFMVGGGAGAAPATITNAAATAQLNLFTSTLQGLVPASGGGTTNFLRADGSWVAAGGGTPGGASLTVQYNNGGAFGGMSGTSWDDTNRALTMTGATVTTSNPIFNMSQTWNAAVAFTALKLNITNTSSTNGTTTSLGSMYLDFEVASTTTFAIYRAGSADPTLWFSRPGDTSNVTVSGGSGILTVTRTDTAAIAWIQSFGSNVGVALNSASPNASFGWSTAAGSATDLSLFRAGAGILSQSIGANAQVYRIYNTTDSNSSPTNYERLALDWQATSNVATFGPQKGGTGTLRYMQQTVAFASQPPTTKTANYSQTVADEWLIFNGAGSLTLTLLSAASFPGLELYVLTIAAQTVVSASSNVIPRAGGAAGTAILAGAAGNWALLVSNGTNWQIMAGTP